MTSEIFWQVLDEALEADKIKGFRAGDFNLAEIVDGLWEITCTLDADFRDLHSVLEQAGIEVGGGFVSSDYMMTEWREYEPGEFSRMMMKRE